MNTKLFLQIGFHLYCTRHQVALVFYIGYRLSKTCLKRSDLWEQIFTVIIMGSLNHSKFERTLLLCHHLGYNADIICLQEVDKSLFDNDLSIQLNDVGLTGLLKLKSGDVTEGAATFFRRSKFRFDYFSLFSKTFSLSFLDEQALLKLLSYISLKLLFVC